MKYLPIAILTGLIIYTEHLEAQKVVTGSGTTTQGSLNNSGPIQSPTSAGGKIKTGKEGTTSTTTPPINSGSSTSGTGGSKGSGNVVTDVLGNVLGGGNVTQGDAASAIKEALSAGVNIGVNKAGAVDGYYKNQLIKIIFPKEAKMVESTLKQVGLGSLTDKFVMSMNRAAEGAAKQAGPIFLNSIKQMTINDAVNIVSNQQPDAATQFLKRTTTESLVTSFKPAIKTSLDKTLATKYWGEITSRYNKIPFVQKVNTDLPDYVTRKAVDGLFVLIGQEEGKIRKDPAARTSEILKKVFGKK